MKDQIAQAFEKRLAPLIKRIEKLEQGLTLEGVGAIVERCAEEEDIMSQLHSLMKLAKQAGEAFYRTVQKKLQSLEARLALLPLAPYIEAVQFAQSILALNPIILVTDDTVNTEYQLKLTRIFLMGLTKVPCFDYQFPPSLVDGKVASIGDHPLLTSFEREWTHLQKALQGRYVVAFHLPFIQTQLAVTARECGLPIPMLTGHSLLDLLLKYARIKDPIDGDFDEDVPPFSDIQLCSLLAEEDVTPFIDLNSSSADQRALHLLQALQEMANGTFSLQEPLPISVLMSFTDPFSEKG